MRIFVIVLIALCLLTSVCLAVTTQPIPKLTVTKSYWHEHPDANPKAPYKDADVDGIVYATGSYKDVNISIAIYDRQNVRVRTMTATIERINAGEQARFCSGPDVKLEKPTAVEDKYSYKIESVTGTLL